MGVTMKNIELEKKLKTLLLLKEKHLSLGKTSKNVGLPVPTISNIKKQEGRIEHFMKEYAKLFDGGLPYLLWPEIMTMKKNEKETEADLRKKIKYLEAKVAYYEELSKLEGLDLALSAKKNGSGQSSSSSKEK